MSDPETLVRELTSKLEQLRDVIENDNIPSDLQLQLNKLIRASRSRSGSGWSSFTSSPLHTGLGTSPSQFSPPTFTTAIQQDDLSVALHEALQRERALQQENQELRHAYNNATRWKGELVELRKRCGISVQELEELTFAEQSPTLSNQATERSSYSTSASTRLSSSTVLTTPSSSYPQTDPPHPTPTSGTRPPSFFASIDSALSSTPLWHQNRSQSATTRSPHPAISNSSLDLDDLYLLNNLNGPSGSVTPLSMSPGSHSGNRSRRSSTGFPRTIVRV